MIDDSPLRQLARHYSEGRLEREQYVAQRRILIDSLTDERSRPEAVQSVEHTAISSATADYSPNFPEIQGYKIVRELGQGGMAVAYLALQELFDRAVALKVMKSSSSADQQFAERFLREAKIIGRLSHNHIVPVYEVGERDGNHFFSMEFLSAGDLVHRIETGLGIAEAIEIISQIAEALNYAHTHGVIHRDVKPDNILFRRTGDAVLTDFGIARNLDDSGRLTTVETIVGSPRYMSPEQARGEQVDTRTDIFSLGIVMFEMLTGEVPFDGTNTAAIALQHVERIPLQLPREASGLQPVLDKMVAIEPGDRYPTASALVDDLKRISPSGERSRGRDFRWRDWRWVSLGSATLVVLVLLLLVINLPDPEEEEIAEVVAVEAVPLETAPAEAVLVEPDHGSQESSGSSEAALASPQALLNPTPEEVYLYSDIVAGKGDLTLSGYVEQYPKNVFTEILIIKAGDLELLGDVQSRAQAGEEAALLILSELTDAGWMVGQDRAAALGLARESARYDYGLGHFQVATILMQTGGGVGEEAIIHLEKSAEAGFFLAMNTLATLALDSEEPGSRRRALDLYRQSVEQGDSEAMYQLGRLLLDDKETPGARPEALALLRGAADKGHSGAQGVLHKLGE